MPNTQPNNKIVILLSIIILLAILAAFYFEKAYKPALKNEQPKQDNLPEETNKEEKNASLPDENIKETNKELANKDKPLLNVTYISGSGRYYESTIAPICSFVRPGNAPIISCEINKAANEEVSLTIGNSVGKDIFIDMLSIGSCAGYISGELKNNEKQAFIISGCNNTVGSILATDISLRYLIKGEDEFTDIGGNLVVRVE